MANIATMSISLVTDVKKLVDGFAKAEKAAKTTVSRIKGFVGILAGAAIFQKLTDAIKNTVDQLDTMGHTAARLGLTVKALQEMRFVAEQSGIAVGNMETAMQRLGRRTDAAAKGTGEAVAAFQRLGLNAKELAKLSPDMIFQRIAQAMEGVANQNERIALAFKFFDTEGVQLLQAMQDGVRGIVELRERAGHFGLVTSEDVKNAQLVKAQMDELNTLITVSIQKTVSQNTREMADFINGMKLGVEFITASLALWVRYSTAFARTITPFIPFLRQTTDTTAQATERARKSLEQRGISREGTIGTPGPAPRERQIINPAAIAQQRGAVMQQRQQAAEMNRFLQSRRQVIDSNLQAATAFAGQNRLGFAATRAQFIEDQRQRFLREESKRRVAGRLAGGTFATNERRVDQMEAKKQKIAEAQLRELQLLNRQFRPLNNAGLSPAAGL